MAAILALTLLLAVGFVGATLLANVIEGHNPTPTLGENTTQVLIAIVGGLIGILGGYVGRRRRS